MTFLSVDPARCLVGVLLALHLALGAHHDRCDVADFAAVRDETDCLALH